jgi:hypothetical protein
LISSFQVGEIHIGSGDLFLIAGPCVIESEEHAIRMAEIIKGVTRALDLPFIFKASYDKARRFEAFVGRELKKGCAFSRRLRTTCKFPFSPTFIKLLTFRKSRKSWMYCRSRPFFVAKPIWLWLRPSAGAL